MRVFISCLRFVCACICRHIYIHIRSIYQSIFVSIYLSIHLSIHIYVPLSVSPRVCLSICLSACPSIHPSIHPSTSGVMLWTEDFGGGVQRRKGAVFKTNMREYAEISSCRSIVVHLKHYILHFAYFHMMPFTAEETAQTLPSIT